MTTDTPILRGGASITFVLTLAALSLTQGCGDSGASDGGPSSGSETTATDSTATPTTTESTTRGAASSSGAADGDTTTSEGGETSPPPPEIIEGHLYVDGRYTGVQSPSTAVVPADATSFGVAVPGGAYYERAVALTRDTDSSEIALVAEDEVPIRTNRALFVVLRQARAGDCVATFTDPEIEALGQFFDLSMEWIERTSHHTAGWSTDRLVLDEPFDLAPSVEPANLYPLLSIEAGEYDSVFASFRFRGDGGCDMGSLGWFGLAYWPPNATNAFTGYVQVKWDQEDLLGTLDGWSDGTEILDGVFVHEWLHTVTEGDMPTLLDYPVPMPPGESGLVVHRAEEYGHTSPWMQWYADIITGRAVRDGEYFGISPAGTAGCGQRSAYLGEC